MPEKPPRHIFSLLMMSRTSGRCCRSSCDGMVFNVRVAASVPEAREEIKAHKFDLLLCDLNIQVLLAGADYDIEPDPQSLLETIATVIRGKKAVKKGLS